MISKRGEPHTIRCTDCRVWRSAVLWFHFVYYAGASTMALTDFRSKRRIMPFVCLLSILVKVLIIFIRRRYSSAAPRPQSPDTGYFWRWLSGKEPHAFPLLKVQKYTWSSYCLVVRKHTVLRVTFRNHLSNIAAYESYYVTDWINARCLASVATFSWY